MSAVMHTPGPWMAIELEGSTTVNWEVHGPKHERRAIAVFPARPKARMDAKLTSAAPDLADALEAFYQLHQYEEHAEECGEFLAARAALRKAGRLE